MRIIFMLLAAALTMLPAPQNTGPAPLRVFIRSGPKTHGPGAHDHPRFLREWVPLLNERGARATGGDVFPTKAQLDDTDVLILHAQDAGNIPDPADRKNLGEFLARGGGLVVIHAAAVSTDPDWFKSIIGGSWRNGTTKWLEGPMQLYFTDRDSPITKDVSNWAMDDEIYYDMDLLPEVRVLAAAYTPKAAGARNAGAQKRAEELTGGGKQVSIYDSSRRCGPTSGRWTAAGRRTAPFVSIPGHLYENFNRPNYRAILLRGIAWAGKRANVDRAPRPRTSCGDALRYVEGGPTASAEGGGEDRGAPGFRPVAGRLGAADPEGDEHRLGREGPAVGLRDARVSRTAGAVPNTTPWKDTGSLQPAVQDRDPEDTISILSDTNGDGIMDKKQVFADKLELVTGFVLYRKRRHRRHLPRHLVSRRHRWRRRRRQADQALHRPRHHRHPRRHQQPALGPRRLDLCHPWLQRRQCHLAGREPSQFGRDGSGVVRFKPDGSAFEQYSSRGGNTWGLDITWDGQVFWTQPTSGTVFFHTVLPEYDSREREGARRRPHGKG